MKKHVKKLLSYPYAKTGLIFLGLIFIDRFTTYFKTYSGVDYPKHSVLFFSLGILLVILSLQSKLGEKVAILTDRFMELFGKDDAADKKKKKKKKQKSAFQLLGDNFVVLGKLMQRPGAKLGDIANAADSCGMKIDVRLTKPLEPFKPQTGTSQIKRPEELQSAEFPVTVLAWGPMVF